MNRNGITGHKRQMDLLEIMLENNTVPQALIFHGIQGTGKQLIARRFLNALFCNEKPPPCLKCSRCRQFINGTFPDMAQLNPGKNGTIPIGDPEKKEEGSVRWLVDIMSRKSLSGRYGVIINGIERVSREGVTAMLKTIEEPQEGACIILIAENRSQVVPTILSRCMEISFPNLSDDEVELVLDREGIAGSYRELAVKISGGSASYAVQLNDKNFIEPLLEICTDISMYMKGESSRLDLDFTRIMKVMDSAHILNLLQNIYRYIYISLVRNTVIRSELSVIKLKDADLLKKIIKIFLALREGLTNNLNIRSSLKGMLYSIKLN